jgi:HEAT repeat protein
MRKRTENRIRKAIRIASQAEAVFARRCTQLEHKGRTLEGALVAITADRQAPVAERSMAAQLLTLTGSYPDPYRPLFDHFLDCDGKTAWDLTNAFLFSNYRPNPEDERRLAWILQSDPDEERRAATAQFLAHPKSAAVRRMLIETLENRKETSYVRGRAAEALTMHYSPDAFEACIRCLSDPDPGARFWAVFALGSIARFRPRLHSVAIPALRAMVDDAGEPEPGYWSVGREARAMLEDMVPKEYESGEKERAAILLDPDAPSDLRRWAECYSRASKDHDKPRSYIQARYKNLRWLRFRSVEAPK